MHAKEVIQSLEKEVQKLRTDNIAKDQIIKKLQNYPKAQNNTTSDFMLPSEFKKQWEALTHDYLMDLFSEFLESQETFAKLAQSLMKLIIEYAEQQINKKVSVISGILGGCEEFSLKKYMQYFFQEHCSSAFESPKTEKVRTKYWNRVCDLVSSRQFESLTKSKEFQNFTELMHKLSLHINLNEPKLVVNFKESIERRVLNSPEDFYCIDGFPKKGHKCIVVVPEVTRGNYAYQNIKPAVLIQNDPYKTPPKSHRHSPVVEKFLRSSPLEHTKNPQCPMCRPKLPCSSCSKSALMAIAERVQINSALNRYSVRVRAYSSNLLQQSSDTKSSLLALNLSKAANKSRSQLFNKY